MMNRAKMLNPEELQALYSRTNHKTRNLWQGNPDPGRVRETAFYDRYKFAITSGIQPEVTPPLRQLLQEINTLSENDPLADAMPVNGLHFTFFAITMPLYQRHELAAIDAELVAIFAKYAKNLTATIRNLRLVALPNQLLIAGTPDAQSQAAKQAFAHQLIDSPWREKLRERHGDIPLPPPFWHSTLLRYQADYLPAQFREYFHARQTCNYGEVSGEVSLSLTNYNWTQVHSVEL